jgi:YesN/AraC family two-component response regulator
VSNLVSNAIKYNRPGGEVNVFLQWDDKKLELKVQDNGAGMDRKTKEKVFERFYRDEKQKNKPGFGIGLSVVAELVQQLKGTIDVQSEFNQGTTMTVYLPQPLVPTPETNEVSDHTEWVLVVEDDTGIYSFIKEVLDRAGIASQRAVNGQQGFDMSLEQLPDLVITDVMMPVEDGINMTTRLKNHALTRHIPVLMLSARAAISSRLEGMQSGADVYLSKPFHPDELLLLVQNLRQTLKQNRLKFAGELKHEEKEYKERLSGHDEYLRKIVEVMEAHLDEPEFSVNELAEVMCISRSQLHRKITALTGFSTTHFIRIIRLEKAKDLLQRHAGNVTEVAYQCGFTSQSYFTKSFTEHFGKAPSAFLK